MRGNSRAAEYLTNLIIEQTEVMIRIITRTVVILSVVSLFADIASEMLYPVVPLYLDQIGFTVLGMGLLEGIANFTAGISKGYFGKLSDEKGFRLPFVKWGYFLSALSKPMFALLTYPIWIIFSRTTDRLGKGVRTAPRDALLSQEATTETKARVFGFHRSMDTLGATIGPVLALVYLYFYPNDYRTVFFLAFIPGIISVLLIFLIKEKRKPSSTLPKGNLFSFLNYWKIASADYKRLVTGLLLFAVINSSDLFLILKTKEITGSDSLTITAYIFYNLVFALASYPVGVIADRFNFRTVFIFGLLLFGIVYIGFAFDPSLPFLFVLFFIYGIYAASTESIAKAWISNLSHQSNTATALGFYTSCQSACALLASTLAGLIWTFSGSQGTFLVTGAASLVIILYFLRFKSLSYFNTKKQLPQ